MQGVCERRPDDFRMVVMSATLDAASFCRYFGGAKAAYIQVRVWRVGRVAARAWPSSSGGSGSPLHRRRRAAACTPSSRPDHRRPLRLPRVCLCLNRAASSLWRSCTPPHQRTATSTPPSAPPCRRAAPCRAAAPPCTRVPECAPRPPRAGRRPCISRLPPSLPLAPTALPLSTGALRRGPRRHPGLPHRPGRD